MIIGNNKATNVLVVRFWSHKHYGEKRTQRTNIYRGTIVDVKTGEQQHFHNAGQFISRLEEMERKRQSELLNRMRESGL